MERFTVSSAADLVALCVLCQGYIPEQSLYLVPLGARGSAPQGVRVDLLDDPEEFAAGLADLVAMLNRFDVERVAAVVFGTSEQAEAADTTLRACAGLTVDDLLVTDGVSWVRSLGCSEACGCSVSTPVDLGSHPLIAIGVSAGALTLTGEDEIRAAYVPRGDLASWPERGPEELPGAPGAVAAALLAEVLPSKGHPVMDLSSGQVHRLVGAAHRIPVRDALFTSIEVSTARWHRELWRAVAVQTPPSLAGPVLALAGCAAWLSGAGALARIALTEAAECDPQLTMTRLLTAAVLGGMSPTQGAAMFAEMRSEGAHAVAS